MALIEKRNYIQGDSEAIVDQDIGTFVINAESYIKFDGYFKFLFANPIIKLKSTSAVLVLNTDYTLVTDTRYTAKEAETGGTGYTVYSQLKIINATYAGVELTFSGDNMGSYTDNEAVYELFFAGEIKEIAFSTVPDGWMECDGSAISRTNYDRLFAAISTTWGVGDGSTTFNLPDFRGVFLRGAGANGTLQDASGAAFDGGSVGDTDNDKSQGWQAGTTIGGVDYYGYGQAADNRPVAEAAAGYGLNRFNVGVQGNAAMITASDDGTNGPPRTGGETQPVNATIKFIIKL